MRKQRLLTGITGILMAFLLAGCDNQSTVFNRIVINNRAIILCRLPFGCFFKHLRKFYTQSQGPCFQPGIVMNDRFKESSVSSAWSHLLVFVRILAVYVKISLQIFFSLSVSLSSYEA